VISIMFMCIFKCAFKFGLGSDLALCWGFGLGLDSNHPLWFGLGLG
jgi:hypothetical protein